MSTRWQLTAVALCMILVAPLALDADIYRWDNGQVIPGTEGITPGPGVQLYRMQLEYAKLNDANLTGASFFQSTLAHADLSGVNLTYADLWQGDLTAANLTGATITGTNLGEATRYGFVDSQLYSTASYQMKDLRGLALSGSTGMYLTNLSTWDFHGQNLADASLHLCNLTDADLSGADLTNASFSNSQLSGAKFTGAIVTRASLTHATEYGFTKEQLYSTASYKDRNLQGIGLWNNDLTGWDFRGQNLASAELRNSTFDAAIFDSATTYNQWTTFPDGFDPVTASLQFRPSSDGDFHVDGILNSIDIDLLTARLLGVSHYSWDPPHAAFDLNDDNELDHTDRLFWVRHLRHTWFGDADLNGAFNSSDFVQVFVAGNYETGWGNPRGNSYLHTSWSEGDWNGDGLFDSDDFVTAFQDGGYEQGPRTDAAAVPEPGGEVLLILGLAGVMRRRRIV